MKYALFAGECFYSCGPFEDLICVCESFAEVESEIERLKHHSYYEWYQVYDNQFNLIKCSEHQPYGSTYGKFLCDNVENL